MSTKPPRLPFDQFVILGITADLIEVSDDRKYTSVEDVYKEYKGRAGELGTKDYEKSTIYNKMTKLRCRGYLVTNEDYMRSEDGTSRGIYKAYQVTCEGYRVLEEQYEVYIRYLNPILT